MSSIEESRHARSRAQIAEAALAQLSEGGERSLTMRAVAGRLGVQASSLYNYVQDKDDLLRVLAEHALSEPIQVNGDWQDRTREIVDRITRTIVRNPSVACVIRAAPDTALRILRAQVSDALRDAPLDETSREHAVDAMSALLVGFVGWVANPEIGQDTALAARHQDVGSVSELLLAGIASTCGSPELVRTA